ncbi:MAG: tyrosine-type recombinase/integrase [Myxococcales bacterium]|nr:tyrosine-type recombinase/integrase [Myxococcales bacterium]
MTKTNGLISAVTMYLRYLKIERNLAGHTILAYTRDLRHMCTYLREVEVTEPRVVRDEHLVGWAQMLAKSGKKNSSQARMLVSARGFWKWLRQEGLIDYSATEALVLPKGMVKRLPEMVGGSEACALLRAGESARDRAWVALLYGAGLRVSEVVDLELEDVDFEALSLRVRGKGSKERMVPLGPVVAKFLEHYVERERSVDARAATTNTVFPGRSRTLRVSRQTIFLRLKQLAAKANLDPQLVSPHKLRHGYATDLVRGGADLRAIQVMLGHADLRTTEIYTQVDGRHLRRVYDGTHPRR